MPPVSSAVTMTSRPCPRPLFRARLLASVAGLFLLSVCRAGAATLDTSPSTNLFGLTRLWTIDLRLSATNWSAMEPKSRRFGGGPAGFHPRPEPPGPRGARVSVGPRPGPDSRPADRPIGGPRPPGPEPAKAEYPWSSCSFESGGTVFTNVAIRFKGNSSFGMSRGGFKRPFKLDFNRGAKGRQWRGSTELFLNNNANDATQLREAVAYEAYREAGLPAPRTAFAKVYLTLDDQPRRYLGLYTLVEPVDARFLKSRFGSKQGLLLKPERIPTIEYFGEDWTAYPNLYDPQSTPSRDETRRLIGLARLIAQADDPTFRRELPGQLDVTNLLRYVAVTAWLANYDSFVGNGHNYYLFLPPEPGRATFIPWDLNEAFGGHPPGGSRSHQAEFSVFRPQAGRNRLLDRVLAAPAWAAEYRQILVALLAGPCQPERLRADVARVIETIQGAVAEESPAARARFERIALGRAGDNSPAPPQPGEGWPQGPGGILQRLEDLALGDWIDRRADRVRAELAGTRTGTTPDLGRRPGAFGGGPGPDVGPGFGPGPGVGFGPRREEAPQRRPDR